MVRLSQPSTLDTVHGHKEGLDVLDRRSAGPMAGWGSAANKKADATRDCRPPPIFPRTWCFDCSAAGSKVEGVVIATCEVLPATFVSVFTLAGVAAAAVAATDASTTAPRGRSPETLVLLFGVDAVGKREVPEAVRGFRRPPVCLGVLVPDGGGGGGGSEQNETRDRRGRGQNKESCKAAKQSRPKKYAPPQQVKIQPCAPYLPCIRPPLRVQKKAHARQKKVHARKKRYTRAKKGTRALGNRTTK